MTTDIDLGPERTAKPRGRLQPARRPMSLLNEFAQWVCPMGLPNAIGQTHWANPLGKPLFNLKREKKKKITSPLGKPFYSFFKIKKYESYLFIKFNQNKVCPMGLLIFFSFLFLN